MRFEESRMEKIAKAMLTLNTLGLSGFGGTVVTLAIIFGGYAVAQIYAKHSWGNALWAIIVIVVLLGALFLEPRYAKFHDEIREKQRRPENYRLTSQEKFWTNGAGRNRTDDVVNSTLALD